MLTKNTFVEEIRKQYVLVARAKGSPTNACCTSTCSATRSSDRDRVPGGVRRRLLRRVAADRDAVLARRPGPAVVRVADPPRLSVVLGTLYFFTLIGLVVKLVADLIYVLVDPRVQSARRPGEDPWTP